MKNRYATLSLFNTTLLLFLFLSSYGQTFVNVNATGNNDGTSWVDAYVDLSDAVENNTTGEIWVAQGSYTPTNGSFNIISSVAVYGGFTGIETALSQRDFMTNTTVLSGDINGDDIEDDFDNNRDDNATHVIYVDSLLSSTVVIDGFDIVSGHTGDDPDLPETEWRGGGIFSYSTVEVNNCIFLQNFGRSGAGAYVNSNAGGGDNSSFSNCIFRENRSTAQSAGLFLNNVNNIEITACDFSFNQTTRGAFYPLQCENVTVTNSSFANNQSIDVTGFGGAIFSWNNSMLTFTSCNFSENTAGNGGVMYIDGRELDIDNTSVVFSNCQFTGNRALDFGGGAIYCWMGSYDVTGSTFGSNFGDNGSHTFNGGEDKRITMENTEFIGGSALFGGATNCYGTNSFYEIKTCSFMGNQAATSGGAIIAGFGAELEIDNCEFIENMASFGGGISVQNDLTTLNINDCTFSKNEASQDGGGLRMSSSGNLFIERCNFKDNDADIGGGLYVAETIDSLGTLTLGLTNTRFTGNTAGTQGAGINLLNVNGLIGNMLCTGNFNTQGVAGGGLSINVSDNAQKNLNITNSTIANNFAPVGGGIATFTDSTNSELTVLIQNTILFNTGSKDYEVEDGTPMVISSGGNLSGDLSTMDIFTNVSDQNNISDMFFVDEQSDYHLTAQSPAINVGNSNGTSPLDLDGNPRVDEVDAGAFEFQGMVNTTETYLSENDIITLYPNPTSDYINVSFETKWKGDFRISVYSMDGKEIQNWQKEKRDLLFTELLDISTLETNTYKIVIDNGNHLTTRKFIKIK